MKLWNLITLSIAFLLILSGCGGAKPKPNDKTVVDSTLPVISLTENGVIADMNSIAFEWHSIMDPRVDGIYIYKKSPKKDATGKLEYYATLDGRFKTHYIDSDVSPDTRYSYAFAVVSKKLRGKRSDVIVVNSLPVLESVSWIHSVTGMPRTAKIIWRPHINQKVKEYIIESKTLKDKEWKELATIVGRLNAEYIDTDLKDNYVYMYRVRVKTFDGIVSTPSQIVRVVTKALPRSINNIKTTINLPKKIRLEWDTSTQRDFSLYYLYRSDKIDGNYKLIATLHNNKYINKIDEDGKVFFYRVSAVDKDGLESIHDKNSIEGMTLPKPLAPVIVQAKLIGSQIEILWNKGDNRSTSYIVKITHKKGWFDKTTKEIKDIKINKFVDKDIKSNSTYIYVVYGVDDNGIKSNPSIEAKVMIPESDKIQRVSNALQEKEVSVKPIVQQNKEIISQDEALDLSGI